MVASPLNARVRKFVRAHPISFPYVLTCAIAVILLERHPW